MIPQVYITETAFRDILALAAKKERCETGGLVLGRAYNYDTGRLLVVSRVSGPGPRAKLREHSFCPDLTYYRKMRQRYRELVYIGEWHKHPDGCTSWSQYDLRQARKILREEPVAEILCPICCVAEDGEMRLQCFYLNRALDSFLPLSYSLIGDHEADRSIRRIVLEAELMQQFLDSGQASQIVSGDIYAKDRIAHLFARPHRGNGRAVLVNPQVCQELDLSPELDFAVAVRGEGARGYELQAGSEQIRELPVDVISLADDVFQRNRALLETSQLKKKHVALLGIGSVGSVAALELARAGVGELTLIDNDEVAVENLCRHVCDVSEIGVAKVDAVARRLARIAPYAKIHACRCDVNEDPDKTLHLCRNADAILISTDTENSRRLGNWVAHELGVPAIFAGVLERAVGGRVWRVVPGNTACYDCHSDFQRADLPRGPVSYSQVQSPRELAIQPGLGNDIAFVTHLAVRYTLDALMPEISEIPYDVVFWFNRNEPKWNVEALGSYRVEQLPINLECPTCFLYREVLEKK